MNVAFGSAARKVSRHQLYKHVNAHVYLGVLAYYAKQRPSRCGEPHDHVDEPFAWHNFRIPRFGVCNLISGFGYHLIQPLEAHIHVYTYFVYGESGLLGGGGNGMARGGA